MITLFGYWNLPRILVVDDDPDITAIIKNALEASGLTVDIFNKPEEALSKFKKDYYVMIITDIRMPGMNGFELYREVKKMDSKIKFAFMTAFAIYQDEFKKIFTSIDVKFLINKPVSISDLAGRVKEELAKDEITFS